MKGGLGSISIIWDVALGMALKFYTRMTKVLKLKIRKLCGLIPTFVEITGKKTGRGWASPILNWVYTLKNAL